MDRQVLEAAFGECGRLGMPVLVEAPAHQLDVNGRSMRPSPRDFATLVRDIADAAGFPFERVLLGVDALGPRAWPPELSEVAMAHAETLAAQCIHAGIRRLHVDCATACPDDPVVLPERLVAARSARLCQAAELAHAALAPGDRRAAPVYVLGCAVPRGDGADAPASVARMRDLYRDAFHFRGLVPAAWSRVLAPAMDDGADDRTLRELHRLIEREPGMVYETPVSTAHRPLAGEGTARRAGARAPRLTR
jgi:D-tagatose-1,6-bisphosphate aldolase subunit GatZ/KbaZ